MKQKMEELKYFMNYCTSHVYQYHAMYAFVYFWTWNKIATVPLYIQNQNLQNKTPHSQKND